MAISITSHQPNKIHNEGIDLVYLWVDGSDPEWIKKKNIYLDKEAETSGEGNCKGRFIDNNELKYSLRSVEQHIPWVRKIFIITDNQVPLWLDTKHPKVFIIDHAQILPKESLPCFNSTVIEYFLYKIPGLSDHFLYANDDFFFNANLTPSFFFEGERPIVRLKKKPLGKWHNRFKKMRGMELGLYRSKLDIAASLVEKKFGKYYAGHPHHNVDAFDKNVYRKAVEDIFNKEIKKSVSNRVRTHGELHRSAFSFYALATGQSCLNYVKRTTSLRIPLYKTDILERLQKYRPALFCLNDDQKVSDADRRRVKPFLENYFPKKSSFEL